MSVNTDLSETIMARGREKRVPAISTGNPSQAQTRHSSVRRGAGGLCSPQRRALRAPKQRPSSSPQGGQGAGSPSLGHAAGLAITTLRLLLGRVPPGL